MQCCLVTSFFGCIHAKCEWHLSTTFSYVGYLFSSPSPTCNIYIKNSKNEALIIHSPVVMKETGAFNSAKRRVSITDIDINEEQKVKYSEQYGLFTENTWNCEISHEVEPGNDDFILADRSDFSAFAGTKLQTYLERNHINHFFIM
jgi:nicotinamidase-related amidase